MKCVYCKREAKPTKEHIISSGVLDLFPECFLTIDNYRKKVYPSDMVINDVCAVCNNEKISYIDSYAKEFIGQYFVSKYDASSSLNINFDYALVQKMLLKYAFNDMRSRGEDTSFFDDDVIHFLMSKDDNKPLRNVTVLAGLAVNTSPIWDFCLGNIKIQMCKNPAFLSNSILENTDYNTGCCVERDKLEIQKFKSLVTSYAFRFNSGQFIIMCWDKNITDEDLNINNGLISFMYPYTLLSNSGSSCISRCTSEITYHLLGLIDVSWGQDMFDTITDARNTLNPSGKACFDKVSQLFEEEEVKIKEKHKRR